MPAPNQGEVQSSADEIKSREETMVARVLNICAEEDLTYGQAIAFISAVSSRLQQLVFSSPVPGA